MKKEVLITGGAGYIGTTLIPELLVKGYNVTVYDSLSYEGDILIPYFANPNFSFIKGDIFLLESILSLFFISDINSEISVDELFLISLNLLSALFIISATKTNLSCYGS